MPSYAQADWAENRTDRMSDLVLSPRPTTGTVSYSGPQFMTLPCEVRLMVFDSLFEVEEAALIGNERAQEESSYPYGRKVPILYREKLDPVQPTISMLRQMGRFDPLIDREIELLQSWNVVLEPALNPAQLRRRIIPAMCDASRQLCEEALPKLYKDTQDTPLRFAFMRTYETSIECLEKLERFLVDHQALGPRFDIVALPHDHNWREVEARLLPGGSLGDIFRGMKSNMVSVSSKVDGIPARLFAPNPTVPSNRRTQQERRYYRHGVEI